MYFNQQFDLSAFAMHRLGVFNPLMGPDSLLFVDPKLFEGSNDEFQNAREELTGYFKDVVDLIKLSTSKGDTFWTSARDMMISKEKAGAGIGYSKNGRKGKGIGPILAGQIIDRACEIMPHVDYKPNLFELVGIFTKNLGCDRLSDMIVSILADRFYAYTQRVAHELGIHQLVDLTSRSGKVFRCPCFSTKDGPLILFPKRILKPLPVAADIGEALENANLDEGMRKQLNAIVAAAQKNGRDPGKSELQDFIFARPNLFKEILTGYEKAQSEAYDFDLDRRHVGDSAAIAKEIVGKPNPPNANLTPAERVEAMLESVLSTLRKLVEENRLSELLFNEDGSAKKEAAAQRLIFSIAEVISKTYDVDVSKEPNAGNGPVDFKLSHGREARILIEVKLSSHPRIKEGFYAQLPAYAKSEGVKRLVLLVVQIDDSDAQIKFLQERILEDPQNTIQLELIDARSKPSASKRTIKN